MADSDSKYFGNDAPDNENFGYANEQAYVDSWAERNADNGNPFEGPVSSDGKTLASQYARELARGN